MFVSKKGVTPIIAVVLLLIMTVSAAGTAFYWLHLIEGKLDAEKQANVKTFGPSEAQVSIVASNYNADPGNLILFIKNAGGEAVPIKTVSTAPTTLWMLMDPQEKIICSTDWSGIENSPTCKEGCAGAIAPGELRRLIIGNLGSGTLCDVTKQPSNSLIQYTIDFSGKASANGGFVR